MELLLNGLMRQGAQRDRLEAKLFGGARMMQGLSDIGAKNSEFARNFLKYEGIRIVGGDTGGEKRPAPAILAGIGPRAAELHHLGRRIRQPRLGEPYAPSRRRRAGVRRNRSVLSLRASPEESASVTSKNTTRKRCQLEPIAGALARAGAELSHIVKMINDLEDVVGHAISHANSTRELKIAELQQLDRARQKIEAAAEFLLTLTQMAKPDWLIDARHAARSVMMGEIARRLGGVGDAAGPRAGVDAYELF